MSLSPQRPAGRLQNVRHDCFSVACLVFVFRPRLSSHPEVPVNFASPRWSRRDPTTQAVQLTAVAVFQGRHNRRPV